jgi:hypothetical protein
VEDGYCILLAVGVSISDVMLRTANNSAIRNALCSTYRECAVCERLQLEAGRPLWHPVARKYDYGDGNVL